MQVIGLGDIGGHNYKNINPIEFVWKNL